MPQESRKIQREIRTFCKSFLSQRTLTLILKSNKIFS
jgi:hypothetical protein